MTPIHPITLLTTRAALKRTLYTAAFGVAIGFSAAVASLQYVQPVLADSTRILRAACKLPDIDGAVTIFTMRDSKLECGRYR